MATSTTRAAIGNVSGSSIPIVPETSVVFRGDGEPNSPDLLLSRLVQAGSEIGFEADSYSLGGSVKRLEDRFAGFHFEIFAENVARQTGPGSHVRRQAGSQDLQSLDEAILRRRGTARGVSRSTQFQLRRLSDGALRDPNPGQPRQGITGQTRLRCDL